MLCRTLRSVFLNKFSENYRAALQFYMPVILRMWIMTVDRLVDYLLRSPEKMLGEKLDIWGRCKKDTLIENVPQYHFLLWLKLQCKS